MKWAAQTRTDDGLQRHFAYQRAQSLEVINLLSMPTRLHSFKSTLLSCFKQPYLF